MNINQTSFDGNLLEVLEAISTAHFVSFDLELTGIPSKGAPGRRQKQTVEQRYQEVKAAAEKFQILQVGITCAKEGGNGDAYLLQSYNFNLSPHPTEDIDINRIFSCDSDALKFLVSHGFDITEPFLSGVPYLSHEEEQLAKERLVARSTRTYDNIEVPRDDVDTLRFLDGVRKDVDSWEKGSSESANAWESSDHRSLFIVSRLQPASQYQHGGDLSAFDRRLVHQLIRLEYPQLKSYGRDKCVMIRKSDQFVEAAASQQKHKTGQEKIKRQVGFRTIVDAMTGKSLHDIDITRFAKDPINGDNITFDRDDISARFNRATHWLSKQRPVLVGHNMFLDLVYFYRTFIGPLPNSVSEFASLIHKTFPMIVDTKYMATHSADHINPSSRLDEIAYSLRTQPAPAICMHKKHNRYLQKQALHEAGFDSYLTAKVMILLSAKLEASGTYVSESPYDSEAESYHTALEPRSATPEELDGVAKNLSSSPIETPVQADKVKTDQADATIPTLGSTTSEPLKKKDKKKKKKRKSKSDTPTSSRFSHDNPFSALADELETNSTATATDPMLEAVDRAKANFANKSSTDGLAYNHQQTDDNIQSSLNPKATPFFIPGPITAAGYTAPHRFDVLKVKKKSGGASTRKHGEQGELKALMPPFDCDFWRVYGNTLRIFGTLETVLDLDPQRTGFKQDPPSREQVDLSQVEW